MGDRKFVKIAGVTIMLILMILSAISAPIMPLARPLNGQEVVAAGVALDHGSIPSIGRSCGTNLPISQGTCPLPTSVHG
ncbi:hypothetical protein REPUB_Repub20aG0095800 [Reevesia pubescens]